MRFFKNMTEILVDSEPCPVPVELQPETKVLPKSCDVPSVRTKVRKTIDQNKKYTREKCTECTSCKGGNQHLKRNYQGSSEQNLAAKSSSEDRLTEKRRSPTNGKKCSKKTPNLTDDSEFQTENGHCKVHHIRCYNCGRRKTKQDHECCGDRGSHSNRCNKERTDEHYFDSRTNDVPSKHFQDKSTFTWNPVIPKTQTGRAWVRQSSVVLPYEWEDDCEMIDWVIDQYVQDDTSISAYYKGKIILTLKDALGITTVAADSENLPKKLQSHVSDLNIPDISKLCSESLVMDPKPSKEILNAEPAKSPNLSSPSACKTALASPDSSSEASQSNKCIPAGKAQQCIESNKTCSWTVQLSPPEEQPPPPALGTVTPH
ncbi:uncharacterized protein LOC103185676 [Callorhinchus milii]|uniref:uncharacterized protein LOC103185676 n=1 Tax=Callorhinchus milii TaxID=7868 RepID=UPI0004575019|nr:uncharacterized protein LOC103185676 [Callorhinchus milii]|eukprot:gi/632972121/ref/XP_007902505.1/ PREDICTED: uncharacterized protein LOC103185676 [Callorhinchus milii]